MKERKEMSNKEGRTMFDSFFELHSQNVDNSNNQGFWKLSDEIIENILLENISNKKDVIIADFGGGTGRWVKKLDPYFENSQFYIVDLSKDMLNVAQRKIDNHQYKNKVTLINADISHVNQLEDESIDYVISTYNPISFVSNPQRVIDEIFRVLKYSGRAMIMSQAWYNALYSKIMNYQASTQELLEIFEKKKLVWNDFVPETWQLSQRDLESMFTKAGFQNVESRGIACLVQPQNEDWDQSNQQIGALSQRLNTDREFFDTILKMELSVGRDQTAVNRGMNIMTIGEK